VFAVIGFALKNHFGYSGLHILGIDKQFQVHKTDDSKLTSAGDNS